MQRAADRPEAGRVCRVQHSSYQGRLVLSGRRLVSYSVSTHNCIYSHYLHQVAIPKSLSLLTDGRGSVGAGRRLCWDRCKIGKCLAKQVSTFDACHAMSCSAASLFSDSDCLIPEIRQGRFQPPLCVTNAHEKGAQHFQPG